MVRFNFFGARFLVIGILAMTQLEADGFAQGITTGGQRAFVTGFTPVIGPRGGVGGIDVDVSGVVTTARTSNHKRITSLAEKRFLPSGNNSWVRSERRMVSLAKLESAIQNSIDEGKPLTSDILFLAGLQRVEAVIACPEYSDIVIVGPAEGWELRGGIAVGSDNGQAVLLLDDLLDALQSPEAAFHGKGISCSIDPTEKGMQQLQRLLRRRNVQLDAEGHLAMENAMGEHHITLAGIRPSSHFARVLVGSDYTLKRLAMGIEPSPIPNLPSYLEMLKGSTARSQVSTPRFWLAPRYDRIEKSKNGLSWRFAGPGLQAMTEHAYLNHEGQLVNSEHPDRLANQWVETVTNQFDELATALPIFGQLRGCVDLAVVAAIISQNDLIQRAACPLLLLTDPSKIAGQKFSVPTCVSSVAKVARGRKGWIVSVSGGVDLNVQKVLSAATMQELPANAVEVPKDSSNWWWDE